MTTAPRDGTTLRLLVRYDHDDMGSNPLKDSEAPSWTIGHNSFDNTGEDEWSIAGWDWEQDCYTHSTGTPIGWLPFDPAKPAPPDTTEAFAWVLERADSDAAAPWYWAAGQIDPSRSSAWTQNHMAAIRFARREDAQAVAHRLMRKVPIDVRVCQHGWTP